MRHADLPGAPAALLLSKKDIFDSLKRIDEDPRARNRILSMESAFRARVATLIEGLPQASAEFAQFHTNPFVLMFYSRQQSYSRVAQIERDLVGAKVFSSMETSGGSMIEEVVLPIYGWEAGPSTMQSHESLLDGQKTDQTGGRFVGATLKSGPRTLNDDIAKNIGTELVARAPSWALDHEVKEVDFTYGVLYGTKKQSNKKDSHILRYIDEAKPSSAKVIASHKGGWASSYADGPLTVSATVAGWYRVVGVSGWGEHLDGGLLRADPVLYRSRACTPGRVKLHDSRSGKHS